MRCSKCSGIIDASKLPKGAAFCPYCGNVLEQAQNKKKSAVAYCPFCGQGLPGNAKFCPNCGKSVPEDPSAAVHAQGEQTVLSTAEHSGVEHEGSGKSLLDYAASAIKSTISGEGRRNRLFKQWVDHAGLPEESVPDLEKTALEMEQERAQQLEQYYLAEHKPQKISNTYLAVAIAAVVFIIAAVVIIVLVLS